MEHHVGFEITPAGRVYLHAQRPRGGCADWVKDQRAWAIYARLQERKAANPLPAA